jgi:cell division protease FtsH
MTREEMETRLDVLMAGRAAEFIVYGHYSTGAADDLSRATGIAREMVTRYAMLPELGSASYADSGSDGFLGAAEGFGRRPYSEDTAREIDLAVRRIVDTSFDRALALLQNNREVLEDSARELLEQETLDEVQLVEFFERLEPVSSSVDFESSYNQDALNAEEATTTV